MRVKNQLETLYYNIKYGIKNLVLFFPTIWRWRSWDYDFTIDLLHKSLSELYKSVYVTNTWHVLDEKEKRKMATAVNCLKRLKDNNYLEVDSDKLFADYDFMNFTRQISDSKRIKMHKLFDDQEYLRKQDMEVFTKIFKTKYQRWWS